MSARTILNPANNTTLEVLANNDIELVGGNLNITAPAGNIVINSRMVIKNGMSFGNASAFQLIQGGNLYDFQIGANTLTSFRVQFNGVTFTGYPNVFLTYQSPTQAYNAQITLSASSVSPAGFNYNIYSSVPIPAMSGSWSWMAIGT